VIDRVAHRFELGGLVADAVRVPGGLSNELWRLVTRDGVFAVKRMIVNADRPGFVDKVEAAFAVERRAWVAGVAMPQPVAVPAPGAPWRRSRGHCQPRSSPTCSACTWLPRPVGRDTRNAPGRPTSPTAAARAADSSATHDRQLTMAPPVTAG
jgi:hypothetical protein